MLITGELNIEVPNISYVDIDTFIADTAEVHNSSKMSLEEQTYKERNNRNYPWDRRILEFEGRIFHNYREYEPFKELINLIDSLPIKPSTRVVLMLNQRSQGDYDFNWHFDKDKPFGFRICLGLDVTKPFLEFTKLKDDYKEYNTNMKRIEPYMVDENIFNIVPTKTNTVLCVNGERYPHRVPLNGGTERCAIIVRGELLTTELDFCQRIDDELHS